MTDFKLRDAMLKGGTELLAGLSRRVTRNNRPGDDQANEKEIKGCLPSTFC